MRLAHLHLPQITAFTRVSELQQGLTTRLLTYKKLSSPGSISSQESSSCSSSHSSPHAPPPPPDPAIITFTPNPVYTTGRRDLPPSNTSSYSPTNNNGNLSLPPSLEPIRSLLTGTGSHAPKAEYHPTLRGGQTTYHGPGQMVAYTILDLKRLGLTPRCHIRVLENSVVDLLAKYGVRGFVTEDPGVWVLPRTSSSTTSSSRSPSPSSASTSTLPSSQSTQPQKITAVGVHLRRNISSYGIGLNVTNEPMWYFRQIVACGWEGREVTSLENQGAVAPSAATADKTGHSNEGIIDEVAHEFVEAFVRRVNADLACGETLLGEKIEEVYSVTEKDLLPSL